MKYQILMDSCGEKTPDMNSHENVFSIPLTLLIGKNETIDDETFNQESFLKAVAATEECPKSACPSPEEYLSKFDENAERIYIVTLSANLSGSYNSACLARSLYEEKHPEAKVHVFNSRSASAGETLISLWIMDCEAAGKGFVETIDFVETHISSMETIFVLEDLSFLQRNGRLTGLKFVAARLLHILPILGATREGTIYQLDQARGPKKAMSKLAEHIIGAAKKTNPNKMVIAHCNCPERAALISAEIRKTFPDIKIYVTDTRGVSTLYAGNRGIITAF